MATKPRKHSLGCTVFTTSKLDEKIYITPSYEIQGLFVTFEPQLEMTRTKKMTELEGTKVILPQSSIKEIIYQEIDEKKALKRIQSQKG